MKGNKRNFTAFGSQHGHKVQGRACIALAIKFPHFSLARAELYSELRVAQMIVCKLSKNYWPLPGQLHCTCIW